ncbi:MAG TPA: 2-dehydropantoate 2-reductase N-terminal domain-containing protein [Euzebya sp.]|nr:2-dehydropantoate 2-reductase N-terminal domain-containing protein [Euzebya sp.]
MTSSPVKTTPTFLIVGPGAIGGTLAVQLHRAGHSVEVVARGAHLEAIREEGLELVAPDGRWTAPLVSHARVSEATITTDTVVVLATKDHQVEPVLDELLAHAGPGVEVACTHNGVEGERLALRRFRNVHGVLINVPGVHLTPGRVEVYAAVPRGVLDIGRYPVGSDLTTRMIAAAFTQAQFLSEACHDVMARKWAKLLGNVGNSLQVLCGLDADIDPLHRVLRAEAEQVAAAAGVSVDQDTQSHRARLVARAPIGGVARHGGSTWQSAVRGTGGVEVAMLNGEICLLGRLHGVATPANELIQTEVLALLARGGAVGTHTVGALLDRIAG